MKPLLVLLADRIWIMGEIIVAEVKQDYGRGHARSGGPSVDLSQPVSV